MTRLMREKFASKLTWLEKKQKEPSLADLRKDARIIPTTPHSIMTLADGTTQPCLVIDMSPSGVAVSAQLQPLIGTPLAVGACIGRVVRLLPFGFAVKFIEPLNRNELERRLITRFAPQACRRAPGGAPSRGGVLLVSRASRFWGSFRSATRSRIREAFDFKHVLGNALIRLALPCRRHIARVSPPPRGDRR